MRYCSRSWPRAPASPARARSSNSLGNEAVTRFLVLAPVCDGRLSPQKTGNGTTGLRAARGAFFPAGCRRSAPWSRPLYSDVIVAGWLLKNQRRINKQQINKEEMGDGPGRRIVVRPGSGARGRGGSAVALRRRDADGRRAGDF